jgi:hypothetical protein
MNIANPPDIVSSPASEQYSARRSPAIAVVAAAPAARVYDYVLVALMWLVPDRRIEAHLEGSPGAGGGRQ